MIGLSLALNAVAGMGGGAPIDNGVEIVNHTDTTVTPTAGDGFQVERTTGGGAYNAGAISTDSVDGDCSVVIHWQAGDFTAGFTTADPALDDNYTFEGQKLFWQGGVLYVFSAGGQVGAARTFKPFGKVEYVAATDTVNFYSSDDGVAWGAAIETLGPIGAGSIRKFDSSLNTAGAKFTAKFTGAA